MTRPPADPALASSPSVDTPDAHSPKDKRAGAGAGADTDEFWSQLGASLADGTCLGITLSKRRADAVESPEKVLIRPTLVKGARSYQWASRRGKQETHENLSAEQTAERMRTLLGTCYEQANVFTAVANFEARVTADGRLAVHRGRPTKSTASAQPAAEHNRSKAYLIPEDVPSPFLVEIGVMTHTGKVRASKHAKFRQINRFLELVNDVADHLPPTGELSIVDFGCGKSYLTFALHHLFTAIRGRQVRILGLDRNREVVAECARLSHKLDCRGLEFRVGEIGDEPLEGFLDLAVSLHACDTATDDALAHAVAWKASVILAVPCCQHEVAKGMHANDLAPLEHHGILHEQFASLATDALRAQALEACGYRTQVVEFINLEHTAKNLLIRAVRRPDRIQSTAAAAAYDEFKRFLGLEEIATDRILAAVGSKAEG